MLKTYTLNPLRSENSYTITLSSELLTISGAQSLRLELNNDHQYQIDVNEELHALVLEALFGEHPELESISINENTFTRSLFYQSPLLWLRSKEESSPEVIINTNNISHPKRPSHYHGTHYRRYVPSINKTISFRTITPHDLDIFHEWHNQKRVAFYWELDQKKDELKNYITQGLEKAHQIPMIVEIDNEPVGYYEFYWVKEDRLGPYYEARPYDRGFHFLIGNKNFLGKANTDAITSAGLHFIYLDDERTHFTMAEPRYDNNKVLKYADDTIGWQALKVFDFPHKRAVLLQNSREIFFKGVKL